MLKVCVIHELLLTFYARKRLGAPSCVLRALKKVYTDTKTTYFAESLARGELEFCGALFMLKKR